MNKALSLFFGIDEIFNSPFQVVRHKQREAWEEFAPAFMVDRQKLTLKKRRFSYQITIVNDARKISLTRGMWTRFSVAHHRLCISGQAGLELNSDQLSFFEPSGRK